MRPAFCVGSLTCAALYSAFGAPWLHGTGLDFDGVLGGGQLGVWMCGAVTCRDVVPAGVPLLRPVALVRQKVFLMRAGGGTSINWDLLFHRREPTHPPSCSSEPCIALGVDDAGARATALEPPLHEILSMPNRDHHVRVEPDVDYLECDGMPDAPDEDR